MVVFDSTVAPGTGQAVYMTATAGRLDDPAAVDRGVAVFSRASVRDGERPWGRDEVGDRSRLRLYRAEVLRHWILDPQSPHDVRVGVSP
jgi:hypothetical protein